VQNNLSILPSLSSHGLVFPVIVRKTDGNSDNGTSEIK